MYKKTFICFIWQRTGLFYAETTNKLNKSRNLSVDQGTDDEKEKELKRIAEEASLDEPPTTCCQSGCSNCVFIAWADALTAKMQTASPEIAEKILNSMDDPNMKAYLEMELKIRGLK